MAEESVQDKLLVEEYKSCRSLIEKNIDIIEKTEIYAVGASSAIFVFSLSASTQLVAVASAWLPLIIAILGLMRFRGIDDTIDKINSYLVELEEKYAAINWTTFYRAKNTKKGLKKTRYGFWIVLMVVGAGFGIYMSFNAPQAGNIKAQTHEAGRIFGRSAR